MRRPTTATTLPIVSDGRRKAAIILLSLAVFSLGLLGCGGSDDGGSAEQQDLVTTTPEPSGDAESVTWNLPDGEPISLDPLQSYNASENAPLANMCEQLLKVTPEYNFEPVLAESFERRDPRTWVYQIREGVRFWNGDELTAEDVTFSLQRHLDPANASYYLDPFGREIESVRSTGPLEVTVKTTIPTTIIHQMMAAGLGVIGQADYIKKAGDDYGTPDGGLMCTGPFEFDGWQPGREMTMVRNDDYWDTDSAAKAERFTFRFLTDSATLTNALISGEIDGTFEAPLSGIDQLRSSGTGSLYLGPSTRHVSIAIFDSGINGPLADPAIREALSLVIDREGIAETVYAGTALPAFSSFLRGNISYSYGSDVFTGAYEKLEQPGVDLEAAQALIEEAGGADDAITLAARGGGDTASIQIANSVADAARQAGLEIDIQQMPPGQFINLYFDPDARQAVDAMISPDGWTDFADPLEFLEFHALPTSVQNFTSYDDREVTDTFNQARSEFDDEERRAELAVDAVLNYETDRHLIPIVHPAERLFMSDRITGAAPVFPYFHRPWAASIGTAG